MEAKVDYLFAKKTSLFWRKVKKAQRVLTLSGIIFSND